MKKTEVSFICVMLVEKLSFEKGRKLLCNDVNSENI